MLNDGKIFTVIYSNQMLTVMYKLCPCVSQSHCQCQSVFEVVDRSVSRLLRSFAIFPASRRYRSPSNLSQ